MKRYSLYSLILVLSILGCTESYDAASGLTPTLVPRYLAVSPPSIVFDANYSSPKSLSIESVATPWRIDNSIDWVHLSSLSGSSSASVDVTVSENSSGDDARTGIFYLRSDVSDWSFEAPISIVQTGTFPALSFSSSTVELTGAAQTAAVSVTANCTWEVSCNAAWLTVSKQGDQVSLTASANETEAHRTATVTVSHTGNHNASANLTVRQAPASVTASTESIVCDNVASEIELTINAEAPWKASTAESWIELSPTSGAAGTSTLKILVAPNTSVNERTGYIVLAIVNGQKLQIPIKQRGIYIETDKTELSFKASGESQTFLITSNTSWSITDVPTWVTLSATSGKGDAEITVSATNNASTQSRTATIRVSQEGLTIGNSISLEQAGKAFAISPQSMLFEDTAGLQTLEITAEEAWSISNDATWISLSATSGATHASVTVSVAENESETGRESTVNITMLDKTLHLTIKQKGKVFALDVDSKELLFSASGGDKSLSISSNTYWTLTGAPGWATLSKESGKGDATVTVSAGENPNTTERTDTLYLNLKDKADPTLIVLKQQGKTLNLDPQSLTFSDKSDTQSIRITSDGAWTATTETAWITLSTASGTGDGTIDVSVTENISDAERYGTVSVTLGDKTASVPVSQKGKYLTIDSPLLTCTSQGGSFDITLSTNDTWKAYVEGEATWITLSASSGSGVANLKAIVADNPSVNGRTGYVVIESDHAQNVRVKISQDARYLTIDHQALLFYAKGGTSEAVTVSTDGTYSITCSDAWFAVTQSGSTFTVTAIENSTGQGRTGSITIALTDLKEGSYTLTIPVTQLSKDGAFFRNEYGDDENYDKKNPSSVQLEIQGYGPDSNFDTNHSNQVSVTITSFSSDKNWDVNVAKQSLSVTVVGYKDDSNYDE